MRSYARRQATVLLRQLAGRIRDAERQETPDSVHDLRTGIRRLSECLRTFEIFFPEGEAGKLRRELKKMMDLAGDVRNRDVADKLFGKSEALTSDKVKAKLAREHGKARAALNSTLKAWSSTDFRHRCKSDLKL